GVLLSTSGALFLQSEFNRHCLNLVLKNEVPEPRLCPRHRLPSKRYTRPMDTSDSVRILEEASERAVIEDNSKSGFVVLGGDGMATYGNANSWRSGTSFFSP